ncbi:MAG: hypothetical protein VXY74_14590 [SAR324 cluster bacterium]|nr:hypothetical protein [SAR324 cluster bacterium]
MRILLFSIAVLFLSQLGACSTSCTSVMSSNANYNECVMRNTLS